MISRIKEVFNSLYPNGNVSAFANDIGMAQQTVFNYLHETRKPSLEFVTAILVAYPEISANWLMRGVGTMRETDKLKDLDFDIEDNAEVLKQYILQLKKTIALQDCMLDLHVRFDQKLDPNFENEK